MTEPSNDPLSEFPLLPAHPPESPVPPRVAPAPSVERPRPGIWEAFGWCVAMIVVLQLLPGLCGGYLALESAHRLQPQIDPRLLHFTDDYNIAMLPWIALGQAATIGSALLVAAWRLGTGWRAKLGLRLPRPSHVLLALLGLPGMIVVGMFVDEFARQWLPQLMDLDSTYLMLARWPTIICIVVIGFGPGIGEELWFRGFFGHGLVGRYGVGVGVLLSSLLFGLVHLEPSRIVGAAAVGVLLHLSYLATRSLLVPMMLHMLNNSLSMLALQYPEAGYAQATTDEIPYTVCGAAVLLMLVVGRLLYKSRVGIESDATMVEVKSPIEPMPAGAASPGALGWSAALAITALFVVSAIPTAKNLHATAAPFHVSAPSRGEVEELLRREPMTAANWPTWSARLRQWLPVRTNVCDPAFKAAREFLGRQIGSFRGEPERYHFRSPMQDDAMAWYLHGRAVLLEVNDPLDNAYRARLRGRQAEKLLRRSIELDPTIGRAHYGLAVALFLQSAADDDEHFAEARREAAEGERLDPTTSAKAAEAWAALNKGRYGDAERLYKEVVSERPYDLAMHRAVAQAQVMREDQSRGVRPKH